MLGEKRKIFFKKNVEKVVKIKWKTTIFRKIVSISSEKGVKIKSLKEK